MKRGLVVILTAALAACGPEAASNDANEPTPTPTPDPLTLALSVEITWDTDQPDVDLHVLNETSGGTFGVAPFDCSPTNPTPSWGAVHSGNDVNGWGPETVEIATQQPDTTYRAIVHYYSDDGAGPSTALIRVRLGGEIVHEDSETLGATGAMWDALTITNGVVTQ